jgi:hypothetical protein
MGLKPSLTPTAFVGGMFEGLRTHPPPTQPRVLAKAIWHALW